MLDFLIYMIRPENHQTDKEARASATLTLANICTDTSYAQQVVEQGGARFLICRWVVRVPEVAGAGGDAFGGGHAVISSGRVR